jgi:hypothetical protein
MNMEEGKKEIDERWMEMEEGWKKESIKGIRRKKGGGK